MIMEDFVPAEIAQKLKDLGYNVPFFFFYRTDDKLIHHAMVSNPLVYGKDVDDEVVIAPTVSQVLKWLRDKFEIDLLPTITIRWIDNLNRLRTYSCNIYSPRLNKPIETEYFDSYEEAIFAGIKYILNNLI